MQFNITADIVIFPHGCDVGCQWITVPSFVLVTQITALLYKDTRFSKDPAGKGQFTHSGCLYVTCPCIGCVCVCLCRWGRREDTSMCSSSLTYQYSNLPTAVLCPLLPPTVIMLTEKYRVCAHLCSVSVAWYCWPVLLSQWCFCVFVFRCVCVYVRPALSPFEEIEPGCWHSAE